MVECTSNPKLTKYCDLQATALDLPLVRELATGASDFAGLLDEVLASNGPPITNNVVIHDPIEDAITDHDFELQDKARRDTQGLGLLAAGGRFLETAERTSCAVITQDPIAEDSITDHDFEIQDKHAGSRSVHSVAVLRHGRENILWHNHSGPDRRGCYH